MMRWLLILVLLVPLAPLSAHAQGEPRLSVEMPEGAVIVGQPVILRLKLLVPSWMPKPPIWPTLEVPSLLVRLPERASTPVSETIGGETWSGISRAYRLYPLETGRFEIPAQKLVVTYADPGKPDPITTNLTLEAIRFAAVLPAGAEALDPAIVASGLTLEQQIDGGPDLVAGDAITRIVSVSIKGTTPILLPVLMPVLMPGLDAPTGSPPLRAYPKDPVISEKEQRGVLSGSRVETTVYVAQGEGDVELPGIALTWFNLESGQVETAVLAGMSLSITAPPPPPWGTADYARWLAIALGGIGAIWGFARLLAPRFWRCWRLGVTAWQRSEPYAWRQVNRALKAQDLTQTMAALDNWAGFLPAGDPPDLERLGLAMTRIGAMLYGADVTGVGKGEWHEARRACAQLRKRAKVNARGTRDVLPGLNPTADTTGRREKQF